MSANSLADWNPSLNHSTKPPQIQLQILLLHSPKVSIFLCVSLTVPFALFRLLLNSSILKVPLLIALYIASPPLCQKVSTAICIHSVSVFAFLMLSTRVLIASVGLLPSFTSFAIPIFIAARA